MGMKKKKSVNNQVGAASANQDQKASPGPRGKKGHRPPEENPATGTLPASKKAC